MFCLQLRNRSLLPELQDCFFGTVSLVLLTKTEYMTQTHPLMGPLRSDMETSTGSTFVLLTLLIFLHPVWLVTLHPTRPIRNPLLLLLLLIPPIHPRLLPLMLPSWSPRPHLCVYLTQAQAQSELDRRVQDGNRGSTGAALRPPVMTAIGGDHLWNRSAVGPIARTGLHGRLIASSCSRGPG
jgi:hypothetical protein